MKVNEVKIRPDIPNPLAKLKQIKAEIDQTDDKVTKTALAIKAAELVLPIWNYYYPKDNRPLKAIQAAKSGTAAAYAAAAYASDVAATAAAAAAASSAAYAAAYAAADIYVDDAADDAVDDAIRATKAHFNINENLFSKEWWNKMLDLHESPPNNFENDDNHQYVEDNLSFINKAAIVFNFPVEDMQLAFNGASSLVLMDDVWSNLENSNSYNIQSLGQALLYAKKYKIDPVPYLKAIKNMESLPKPLVLRYAEDKYYLVNGEFILSLQKALNITPDILQATINPKIKEDGSQKDEINLVNEFINYVKENLGLVQTPKIDFSDDIDHVKEQRSFGYFSPDANIIWVYAGDRNMADVFRTLAHELVHRKQEEDGKINYESGKTGSDIENEANAKAGILLRDFGKKYNEIYDTPIKKFIKGSINEVKIQPASINFTFPFEITKNTKSQIPFIVNQLNNQGYTLKNKKFTIEDLNWHIPAVLFYDSNYEPKRKILNIGQYANEVKIQPPFTYKKAYGEVHSYNEMKKWEEQNNTLPSHFLIDRTNNTVLAGFREYNIPKWAWNLHRNENIPAEGNNMFALASRSSITNPPPYLNNPNIDINNPASWGNISKVKQYIKNLNEVKIATPPRTFKFKDDFNYGIIGGTYVVLGQDEDDYKLQNTKTKDIIFCSKHYAETNQNEQPIEEVKIATPSYKIPKISWDTLKQALINDMRETAIDLEFENPEEYINEFTNDINQITNENSDGFLKLDKLYNSYGFDGTDEALLALNRIFIK